MTALISVLSGLLGVCLGAGLSWATTQRERRISTTFELHREFNGIEMTRARYAASKLLSENRDKTFLGLRNAVGNLGMRDVWIVTYFYQRLWLCVKYRAVSLQLVPELFGDLFSWWYDNSFRTQLIPLKTEPAYHVAQLKSWLDRRATAAQLVRWAEGNRQFPIDTADGAKGAVCADLSDRRRPAP